MTRARAAVFVLTTYVIACVVLGITLAEFSLRLPKHLPRTNGDFGKRVLRDFGASVEDVSLSAADGAILRAWYVRSQHPNGESVILLHGITDNRIGVSGFGDIFLRSGYAVLLPDSRAHGDSGGTVATYGILEREDVRRWVEWMRQRNPGCTFLLGESMGAAIGLQATSVTPQLCAVAVESPYSDFREISYERLGRGTHLGSFFWRSAGRPAIEVAILYARLRYGLWLTDASPHRAVQSSTVPTLLIAGTADRNIPMHHAMELYRDCASHCSLWIVPRADHGGASSVAPSEFSSRILQWFKRFDQPLARAK